ncbi:TlyA family RNA methyltransferase [Helicobacter cappadocius]|uniref:TlyA family RNA methyltransferase n=1 Tax=Helicobacter cappadocius TaxID=3063998 RepID=A0AA90PR15_9HELI|nr:MULTISPECIES: TlyA family RNA methyltransferase [unclassified Helicobacter]MDO7252704.1 TlyA family RNA methyltransferase [Helicobacter sp. faydin-H75]MDP2538572.1 TlyA family RNA methyltransferase [Helicobacter sp. faydin-H76]
MRLDIYLAKNNYCKSREKAKELICNGKVKINGSVINKPSFEIIEFIENIVEIDMDEYLVSRAGRKLSGYFFANHIDCDGKKVLDVGSSTGGFAQVLLNFGAIEVVCVDVGCNQLDNALRNNSKIRLFEECDIRDFSLEEKFDLLVCDVSFISLSKILDYLCVFSDELILLFKPQFEVGVGVKRNKKGVIMDKDAIRKRIDQFSTELYAKSLKILNIEKSLLKGKEGNEEFFIHVKKS